RPDRATSTSLHLVPCPVHASTALRASDRKRRDSRLGHTGYDDLHRLVWAHGEARSRPRTTDTFTSTYQYSDIHNMLSNVQVHHVLHGDKGGGEFPPQTNHDFAYQYAGAGPHQATRIGDTSLVYDDAGNTLRECRDPADQTCTQRPAHLRQYSWTEENRLEYVIDGGGKNLTKFFYDAGGQRIAKLGRGGTSLTIGQFWALKGHRAATKHVFAGTTRIASKLLPPPGWDDTPPPPSVEVPVDATGCNPSSYQPQKCTVLQGGEPVINDYYAYVKVRPETYYYHPDHLGSTAWVTDQNAREHEHVEYFPYGEVWRDPRSDVNASPQKGQRFLFTGKELDEETGLTYFGARYYDSKKVRWESADPAIASSQREWFLAPGNLAPYQYALSNPVRNIDPDGRCTVRADRTLDCIGTSLANGAALESSVGDAWRDGRYGSVALGSLLILANYPNVVSGAAGEAIIAFPYNSGHNGMTGLIEGDYDKSLRGWVGTLMLGIGGSFGSTSSAQAPTRVFWSGGKVAQRAAEQWASANGGITLEQTMTGKVLAQMGRVLPFRAMRPLWTWASRRFAEVAAGEVQAIQNAAGVRWPGSVWADTEFPALMESNYVTRIGYQMVEEGGTPVPTP
ncbi:MAG: RHS repeat-associated core domain-containing protein, partial [Anaeromyxobacteraceae bacterium]